MTTATSNHTENVARLLATERITMYKAAVQTASFDIKNRVLVLPNWKDMSNEEELMLVLHETAHALFTTYEDYKVIFSDYPHLKGYCNVIEDARIEMLMKERYAGSRGQFLRGYVSLHKRDFFGVKDARVSALLPIDKLNLYFKIGGLYRVELDAVEQQFAERIAKNRTIAGVIEIAKELYEYSKDKKNEQKFNHSDMFTEGDEESEGNQDKQSLSNYEDGDDQSDSSSSGEEISDDEKDNSSEKESSGNQGGKFSDEDLEPITDRNFYDTLDSTANLTDKIEYVQPVPSHKAMFSDVIVPYTELVDIIRKEESNAHARAVAAKNAGYEFHGSLEGFKFKKNVISKFRRSNAPFVSYMLKEFEMKKAADAIKRTAVSKTGQLDMKKLFAYKVKDDLFRKTAKVTDAKNHGMIFLLDWSSSMEKYMNETVQQVICLASFCHKAQIPYQVLAFSDGYVGSLRRDDPRWSAWRAKHEMIKASNPDNPLGFDASQFNLIELFTHTMSNTEFALMQDLLLSKIYRNNVYGQYQLYGTPLNEAMLYMVDYVGKFKKKYNVQKMSLITLTDGDGSTLRANNKWQQNQPALQQNSMLTVDSFNSKLYINDPLTKMQYDFSWDNVRQVEVMCNIIRDRWDAKVVGFFVAERDISSVNRFVRSNTRDKDGCRLDRDLLDELVRRMYKSISIDGYAAAKNFGGRDEYYYIDAKSKIVDVEDELEGNVYTSDADVTKVFGQALTNSKKSRVVLGKFISLIS